MAQQQSTYKLIVSPELEQKIRYYLDKFPREEYSGTLFYTVSGSFETDDIVINAFDFLLQDIGTSGYTEFDQSPDVVGYMVDHPELLDEYVYQGLMHSHHVLGSFFSGTDLATLREEGSDRIHFVSLIIDTKGTYKAAITRVVVEEMQATGFIKYPTYNNKEVTGSPISYSYSRKKLEYFMLDVERPEIYNPFQELSDRINKVKAQKEASKAKSIASSYGKSNYNGYNYYGQYGYKDWTKKEDKKEIPSNPISYQTNVGRGNTIAPIKTDYTSLQKELPFEDSEDTLPPYGVININPDIIQSVAAQLLTGDVNYCKLPNTSLNDLAISCENLYEKRFQNDMDDKLFNTWAEQFIDFLVYYTEDPELEMLDSDCMAALVAYDLAEVLNSLPNKGKFIESFMKMLDDYII